MSRLTSAKQHIQETVSRKKYILNVDKCLKKQLQAAKRQRVEYVVEGGGVVAILDAVSFECSSLPTKNIITRQISR